jgi:hypothetical protein
MKRYNNKGMILNSQQNHTTLYTIKYDISDHLSKLWKNQHVNNSVK